MDQAHQGAGEAARAISVTLGRSRADKVWTDRRTMPFDEFGRILTAPPAIGAKDGSCFVPAVFREDRRRMDLADQIDIAVLDSDSGNAFEKIIAAVEAKGWRAVVHSTHSHLTDRTEVARSAFDKWRKDTGLDDVARYMLEKKGYLPQVVADAEIAGEAGPSYIVKHQRCPKFRVVIPLAMPWRAADFSGQREANEKWAERIGALAAALGLNHDQSCIDTSRLFYFPRVPSLEARDASQAVSIEGAPCDIWALPPAPADEPRHGTQRAVRRAKASQGGAEAGAAESAPGVHADASAQTGEQIDLRRAGDRNGRSINLIKWSVEYGPRFEAATALRAKAEHIFGNRKSGVKWHIQCPFDDEHTAANDRTGTYVVNAAEISRAGLPSFSAGFYIGCKHNACAGRDRLAFVHKMLEQGTLAAADLTNDDFLVPLPELPPFPLPKRSGERAGRTVRRLVRRFCDREERCLEAMDWRKAEIGRRVGEAGMESMDAAYAKAARVRIIRRVYAESRRKFGPAKRPDYAIAGGAGTGKTSAFIEEYRRRPRLWGRHIWIAEPTRDLCDEVQDKINDKAPEGMPLARTIQGRSTKGMCEFGELAERIGPHVKSTFRTLCKSDHRQCPYFNSCAYNQQFIGPDARDPRIHVITHARLARGQPEDIALPAPDLVVADESVVSTLTRVTHVNPASFGLEEAYHGDSGDRAMAPAYADLGRRIAALVITGGNTIERIKAEMPDVSAGAIADAAKAAAKAAAKNGYIQPGDGDATVGEKLEAIQRNGSEGVSLVLGQLARDLAAGKTIAVTWREQHEEEGVVLPGRIRHHGHDVPPMVRSKTALLVLDADAIPEVNRILFGRNFRSFRVEGRRLGHFTQCKSAEFAKRTLLLPKVINADRHARNEASLGAFLAFARALWKEGSRVLVISNRPVHAALRRLANGGLGDDTDLGMASSIEAGLVLSHFGAFTGRDSWKQFDVAIVIGREQIRAEDAEDIARCVYGDLHDIELALPGKFIKARRRYGPGDDRGWDMWAHPDPRVQALVELYRERASVQGIDRLRLMYSDKRSPRVFIFCALPLPGIVPDALLTTAEMLAGGTRRDRAIARGFITSNSEVLSREHGDLWPSPKAAEHDISRSEGVWIPRANRGAGQVGDSAGKGRNPQSAYSTYMQFGGFYIPGPLEGQFRRRVRRAKWSDISVDPRAYPRIDIKIARHLDMQHIDELEIDGPAAKAVAAARAKDAKLGRLASLSAAKGKLEIGSAEFCRDVFATHPTRIITEDTEGRQVETWHDHAGKLISRPIDAPPLPPPMTEEEKARSKAAFARWLAGRELAKIVETDPDGLVTVTLIDIRSRRPIWRGRRWPATSAA